MIIELEDTTKLENYFYSEGNNRLAGKMYAIGMGGGARGYL